MSATLSLEAYVKALERQVGRHLQPGGIYHGREGHLRLAREVGYGLACYDVEAVDDVMGSLYGKLLIKPTFGTSWMTSLDARPWLDEMRSAIDKARNE